MLHKQVLSPQAFALLKQLMELPSLKAFYLVDGTALALQIGHRLSVDLDLFTDIESEFKPDLIEGELPAAKEVFSVTEMYMGTFISEVKTEFVKYPFIRLYDLIEEEKIRMATLREIAAMKLWAITRRGSKKDFIDLAFLLKEFTLAEMIDDFKKKFPGNNLQMLLRSLVYFTDADSQDDPVMLVSDTWAQMKKNIESTVKNYFKQL